jgi:MSHA biogenesis protein MshQ
LVNNASSYDYTEVPLDFGDDSQNSAKYVFKYDNAGSVLLNARYQLPDEEGNPSGNYITGTSNPIIVRPFGFFIDAKGDTGSSDNGTRPVYKKAGEEFTVELKAVVWQSNDDLFINSTFAPGNDGIPDIGADLSNNAVTDNFGNENTPETATISHQVVAPLSGVGTLTSSAFVFNNGVASNEEVSFSEVGIIRLTANLTDRSYLGAGDIQGNLPLVGRFTPAYFQVTSISDGALKATCSTNETLDLPFVYSGQKLFDNSSIGALGYASTPTITIKARNQDGDLTQNYIDDFFKLTQASFKRLTISPTSTTLAPDTDATQLGKNDNLVRLTANLNDGEINNTAGMITYSYNSNDNFSYLREENSEINPFTADIDLSMVAIIDDDAIATVDFDGNAQNGLIVTLNPVGNKRIRFGRAQLENSYGPETANLAQTLSVKFFKDDQYILKGEVLDTEPDQEADTEPDQCTPYNSNKMSVTNIDLIDFSQSPPNPDITDVSGKFIDEIPFGITRAIELTATGAGNTGSVCVSYDIVPWLKYRWATDVNNLQCPFNADDVDNSFDDNPFGIATFGLFRGNDRIIYQREIE